MENVQYTAPAVESVEPVVGLLDCGGNPGSPSDGTQITGFTNKRHQKF